MSRRVSEIGEIGESETHTARGKHKIAKFIGTLSPCRGVRGGGRGRERNFESVCVCHT